MCRSMQALKRRAEPFEDDDVRAAALQYVRKLSGMRQPSKANQGVVDRAVAQIAHATAHLLADLEPGPPRPPTVPKPRVYPVR